MMARMLLGWVLATVAESASLTLSQPRAELQTDVQPPHLRLWVHADNHLPYPVRRVHLGVLFSHHPVALQGVDFASLYRQGTGLRGEVGVLTQEVDATIPPERGGVVLIGADLSAGAPAPRGYATHVLGYSLADADAPTLMRLLSSSAAADEAAACSTMALADDDTAKTAARQRFGGHITLVHDLIAVITAPTPAKISQAEAFRRVYAVRALGVLGGEEATQALRALLGSPTLGSWDEPLQILRIARLNGSRWETPLAFAVPETARRMEDVVGAAIQDATALPVVVTPEPHTEPAAAPVSWPAWAVWPWALLLVLTLLLAGVLRRRNGTP